MMASLLAYPREKWWEMRTAAWMAERWGDWTVARTAYWSAGAMEKPSVMMLDEKTADSLEISRAAPLELTMDRKSDG